MFRYQPFISMLLGVVTLAMGCEELPLQENLQSRTHTSPPLDSAEPGSNGRPSESPRPTETDDALAADSTAFESPIKGTEQRKPVSRKDDAGIMTLAELESLALTNNPTLSQAAAAVDQQRGEYRQSGRYPNPQIGYLNTTASQSDPKQSNGIFLSQEFVTAKKIPLAKDADLQAIRRLEWDEAAQQMRVLNDVRIRYYEVLGAQRQAAACRELERLSRGHLLVAQNLLEAKHGSKTDVLQARILVDASQVRVGEASYRLEAAWKQLAAMVGQPNLPLSPVPDTVVNSIPELDFETEWQRMLSNSPLMKSAESELQHGQAVLRLARAQAKPNVTIQMVTDYDRVTQATTASVLAAMPLTVFNRNQGNIEKAAADIRADQADIIRSQLVLRDQLADSFRRFNTCRLQDEKLRLSILPAAEESLRMITTGYSRGEVSFREVLLAQEALAQSKIAQIEAATEAYKVQAEIEGMQLTGGLNPAAIGSAIQTQAGGGQRQRALLQEVQDQASKQLLPAAQLGR